jgi:heme-degrading monooxygenase HmoA
VAVVRQWASEQPRAGTLRIVRDLEDDHQFLSFAPWDSGNAAHAWKASADFRERMGAVQQHVSDFTPHEYELVAAVAGAYAAASSAGR